MSEWTTATAPATVSNLGPGFDCIGLALRGPCDRVRVRERAQPGVEVLRISGDRGRLPLDSSKNTAAVAVTTLLERHAPELGVELELEKGLPLGSGLGSSGASACAAVVAVDALFGLDLGLEAKIDAARVAEGVACGSPHPDNVAPAIAGGIVLISRLEPLRVLELPVPEGLYLTVYTPGCEVPTAKARAVLPESVPLAACVRQSARLAQLIHALHIGDLHMLGEAIVDEIVEPARAGLIPGFRDAKVACLEAGALACTISGAGPTTFALSSDESRARALLEIMEETYTLAGVPGLGLVDQVGPGAQVIDH